MIEIIQVESQANYTLLLHFSNGDHAKVALADHLKFVGYFAPLASPTFFEEVSVDHGTLCWPGGIDLDPLVLHAWTMGLPLALADDTVLA